MLLMQSKKFRANNARLAKYLYSLGFDRQIEIVNGKETWLFEFNDLLQESLDFYFYMRKQTQK